MVHDAADAELDDEIFAMKKECNIGRISQFHIHESSAYTLDLGDAQYFVVE